MAMLTIFQYPPGTPLEKLLRHHKIARSIIYPCGYALMLVFSTAAECVVFGLKALPFYLMIGSLCLWGVLVIPALLSLPWMSDIEKELEKKKIPIPGGSLEKRVPRFTLQLMIWFVFIILVLNLVR